MVGVVAPLRYQGAVESCLHRAGRPRPADESPVLFPAVLADAAPRPVDRERLEGKLSVVGGGTEGIGMLSCQLSRHSACELS